MEQLKELIAEHAPEHSTEGLHYKIAKQVSDFMSGTQQEDDMTLIVIKRKTEADETEVKSRTTSWEEK